MRRTIKKRRADEESEIDLTPMLDVVFIMLIFFIVTASFIKEPGVDINRPEAKTARTKTHANIFVAINSNNEVWIDKAKYELKDVKLQIEKMYAENPKGAVIIQVDKEANAKTFASVLDSAKASGILDISLATADK